MQLHVCNVILHHPHPGHSETPRRDIHWDQSESPFTPTARLAPAEMHGRTTRTTIFENANRRLCTTKAKARIHGKGTGAAYVSWLERLAGPTQSELHQRLVQCVQGTNCGKDADAHQRKAVEEAVVALERRNPTKRPTSGPLAGRWRLIYTSETSVHRFLTLLPVTDIYQTIDLDKKRVQNLIQCRVYSSIAAEAPLVIQGPRRLSYFFDVFIFTLLGLSVRVSPGKTPPGGWQETTYVDKSYKIVRNSQSDLLIMEKVVP